MMERIPADVAWLDEIQQPPRTLPSRLPVLSSLLTGITGQSIQTLTDWERHRCELRKRWLDFLGSLEIERKESPGFEVVEEDRLPDVIRIRIRYEVEPGCPTDAYLLKPIKIHCPQPGVVVFHSTVSYTIRQPAGLEGQPEKAFGLKLAERGCIALCPRCFLWPSDSSGRFRKHVKEQMKQLQIRHPRASGMAKMIHDAKVALDLLAHLPEVDPHRLGAVGHSLGAKQVLYLAALDERIRVAVSSEGGIGRSFSNWSAPWYLGQNILRATNQSRGSSPLFGRKRLESWFVRHLLSSDSEREHHELLGLVAARAYLVVGGNSADGDHTWPYIAAALPVYRLYGGKPRLGLFNHRRGHAVPAEAERRIYEWFETYL